MSASANRLTCVLLHRFNMMTLTTVLEPLRIANYLSPAKLYDWEYRSVTKGGITASNGLTIECLGLDEPSPDPFDMVAVFGSWGAERYDNPALSRWLRRQARAGATLIAVELGVYALARAGLLDGYRATTHWSCLAGFAEQFPEVNVCEQLFTIDRKVMTCAGGTAGLDLFLTIVGRQHGEQLAAEVSNQILHHPRRPADGAQRHAPGAKDEHIHPVVRAAMRHMEERIEEPLSVPDLCHAIGVSQRQLERLFRRHTGCTVSQFSKIIRLQYARVLLTSTRMSIREVSAACGFNSMSYFSQCFTRTFGKKPSENRSSWPDDQPAPQWPGTVYSFTQALASTAKR